MWGPTGTGRSNAYFVASLNGGTGGRVSSGVARPLPPVEPPLIRSLPESQRCKRV